MFKWMQVLWIIGCAAATLVYLLTKNNKKPFPSVREKYDNNDDYKEFPESVIGYIKVYKADCIYVICLRFVTALLIISAMVFFYLARQETMRFGMEHKHDLPTCRSHLPALFALLL